MDSQEALLLIWIQVNLNTAVGINNILKYCFNLIVKKCTPLVVKPHTTERLKATKSTSGNPSESPNVSMKSASLDTDSFLQCGLSFKAINH